MEWSGSHCQRSAKHLGGLLAPVVTTHGKLRCLILEPTRELALQVEEAFQKFAKFTDLRVTIVYGGVGYGKQEDDLRCGMDIPSPRR